MPAFVEAKRLLRARPLAEGLDHRHHTGAKALLFHGRRRHQLPDRLGSDGRPVAAVRDGAWWTLERDVAGSVRLEVR
jgi:hypothetical protein